MRQRALSLLLALLLVAAAAVSVHASRNLQPSRGSRPAAALPKGAPKYREGRVSELGPAAWWRRGGAGSSAGAPCSGPDCPAQ